jgi:predicted TIM-barrel fold metal-dependent hydrolase
MWCLRCFHLPEIPDAGHLPELFRRWSPVKATQQRILVDNPARLYGFPN